MKMLDCFKALSMAIAIATAGDVCANENTLLISYPLITNFKFSNQSIGWEGGGYWEGVIDYKNKTITFATQRWIENIDKLSAIFELDGDGVAKVGGKVQFSGATINDFRKDVVYTVGDAEYTVKFVSPQASGLPVIRIDTENGAPILNKEDWVNMSFTLTDPNNPANDISAISNQQIRGRGNTTWDWYPKKPYRVRFRRDVSLFGQAARRNWILLAEYRDPTFLINPTAFELGRKVFKLPYTLTYQHVQVYLNGQYHGVYGLTEHRQADPNGVGAPGRVKVDLNEGWFVEFSSWDNPWFATTSYNLGITIRSPDFGSKIADERYNFVKNDWNELISLMASASFPENRYRDLIDMDNFVDFVMVNEITINADFFNFFSSVFSYKDKGGKINMGPLWDFDNGFAKSAYHDHIFFTTRTFLLPRLDFINRFFEDPVFLVKYKERWNKKYDEIFTIAEFIETLGESIRTAVIEDAKRWNIPGGYKDNYDPDHARQVGFMLDWWRDWTVWLNTEFNKVEVLPKNKTFTTQVFGYTEIAPQPFTLVSYGDMKNLSATLKKEELSEFEVSAKLSKTTTGNGGYLATISVKPKNSLPVETYTDTLVLSGVNQAQRFSIEVPLAFAVNEAAQPAPDIASVYKGGNTAANRAVQTRNGINLITTNNATLEIFNLKGSLISRRNFSSGVHAIQLGHLPKGMYIAKVSFGSEKQILRVPVR